MAHIFFLLPDGLVLAHGLLAIIGLLEPVAETLDVLVELVVMPPQLMSFLLEVKVVVFEVFPAYLAVVGGGRQVFDFLR
jgi:hypothetical protein